MINIEQIEMHAIETIQADRSMPAGSLTDAGYSEHQSLDRTLTEIRSGRRLTRIAASIEGFLSSQITRLEDALEECERVKDSDRVVQKILADFEQEKLAWEDQCQSESRRLNEATDHLIQGWQQLEEERRKWMIERDSHLSGTNR